MVNVNKSFKIVAVNDDVDTCSCCGRTELKRVAWVAEVVHGVEMEPAPYGTTCAAKAVARFETDEYGKARTSRRVSDTIKYVTKTGNPGTVFTESKFDSTPRCTCCGSSNLDPSFGICDSCFIGDAGEIDEASCHC